jgi:hypothetical protein
MIRRSKLLIAVAVAVALCVAVLSRYGARPWYFDETECEARLLEKTPAEVESSIGRRPNYSGRPWREHPELDESQWGSGVSARMAWRFDWGTINVEFDEHGRAVSAEVWWYQPAWGERNRVSVSRR